MWVSWALEDFVNYIINADVHDSSGRSAYRVSVMKVKSKRPKACWTRNSHCSEPQGSATPPTQPLNSVNFPCTASKRSFSKILEVSHQSLIREMEKKALVNLQRSISHRRNIKLKDDLVFTFNYGISTSHRGVITATIGAKKCSTSEAPARSIQTPNRSVISRGFVDRIIELVEKSLIILDHNSLPDGKNSSHTLVMRSVFLRSTYDWINWCYLIAEFLARQPHEHHRMELIVARMWKP